MTENSGQEECDPLKTLLSCYFLSIGSELAKINLNTHHEALLNYIPYLHKIKKSYRAHIISEKLQHSGYNVPPQDYEFILEAQKSGHILGLNQPIVVKTTPKTQKKYSTIGAVNQFSLTFLIEKISAYLVHHSSATAFKTILEALIQTENKMIPHTHLFKPESADFFFQNYQNNHLVILPSGWKGHTTGIGIYQNYVVVCNRGPGTDPGKGTKIYPIIDTSLITPTWIMELIDLENKCNLNDFNTILSKVIDLKKPQYTFPSKPQKNGNCSYANLKSLLEGVHYLLTKPKDITNREKYKHFTEFTRAHQLYLILKKITSPTLLPIQFQFYSHILMAYFKKINLPVKHNLTSYYETLYTYPIIKDLLLQNKDNTEKIISHK
jgi:hypothetical protein